MQHQVDQSCINSDSKVISLQPANLVLNMIHPRYLDSSACVTHLLLALGRYLYFVLRQEIKKKEFWISHVLDDMQTYVKEVFHQMNLHFKYLTGW